MQSKYLMQSSSLILLIPKNLITIAYHANVVPKVRKCDQVNWIRSSIHISIKEMCDNLRKQTEMISIKKLWNQKLKYYHNNIYLVWLKNNNLSTTQNGPKVATKIRAVIHLRTPKLKHSDANLQTMIKKNLKFNLNSRKLKIT
jgi:2C-methyl-D-erythritol 2,4-cyclodiphosphate synthase